MRSSDWSSDVCSSDLYQGIFYNGIPSAFAGIIAALTSLSVGYLWFLFAGSDSPSYLVAILPSVILLGLGVALGYTSIMAQATSGVADSEQGLASGRVNTSAQVGPALVLARTTALAKLGKDKRRERR